MRTTVELPPERGLDDRGTLLRTPPSHSGVSAFAEDALRSCRDSADMLLRHCVPFDGGCALLDHDGAMLYVARGHHARRCCLQEAVRRGAIAVL